MHSLNLMATLPYPPRSGGHLRAWNLCLHLAPLISQTVLCRSMTTPSPGEIDAFTRNGIGLRTALIPRPTPAQRILRGLRHAVGRYPVMIGGWDHPALHARLAQVLSERAYDVVVVDGSSLCSYMPDLAATPALKVVNLYDLQGILLRRKARVMRSGWRKWLALHDAWKMGIAEMRMLRAADLVLVTSEPERDILAASRPDLPVRVVPNGVDCRAIRLLPPTASRELLFVGSLQYQPNVDAVLHFSAEVWPALRNRHPDLALTVVGRDPPHEIQQLDGWAGIHVMGEVDSVHPYYERAAICLAPLRAAGGTRLKILEAMAYGRPVVSTTLGCEGLDVVHGRHLLVADGPPDMAEQVNRLLTEQDLREVLRREGRSLVERRYAWTSIAASLHSGYHEALEARKARSG